MASILNGETATEVLKCLTPSSIREFARYFQILELRDRRREVKKDFASVTSVEGTHLLHMSVMALKSLELVLLKLVAITLRILILVTFGNKLLGKPLRAAFDQVEQGVILAASKSISSEFHVMDTIDEVQAEKGIQRLDGLLDSLNQRYHDNSGVLSYLVKVHSGAMSLGQRWAEAELAYRVSKAQTDQAEAFWRGGFMVRAFGLGTFKLLRNMLVVFALGMAIPWMIDWAKSKDPDFSTVDKIAWGIGWTALLWAVTLGLTLYFNDRRMRAIWKRAKVSLLNAQIIRSKEICILLKESKASLRSSILLFFEFKENDPTSTLVEGSFESIELQIQEHELLASSAQNEIDKLTKKISLKDKIARLLDAGSQGDATEQGMEGVGDILG